MIKESLKQLIRACKEKVRYLKYKNTLPKNPMHDDIYLVEFPKSGITWLQHILGNIELRLQNRNEEITLYNDHKYVPDIHQIFDSHINRQFARTFIKSHSEYNPYYFFVIYIIRNPFDVMVSYYNFMVDLGYSKDFIDFVKDPNYGITAWKRHVNSWIYKKVKPQQFFNKLCDFLEIEPSQYSKIVIQKYENKRSTNKNYKRTKDITLYDKLVEFKTTYFPFIKIKLPSGIKQKLKEIVWKDNKKISKTIFLTEEQKFEILSRYKDSNKKLSEMMQLNLKEYGYYND